MASRPVTLQVKPRGKRIPSLPASTSIYVQGSTADLYHRIAAESNFSVHRLRITREDDGTFIPNDKTKSVESFQLRNGSTILVKDLGLQIAWRTVFIIEYLGPLLIHPFCYLARPYIYKNAPPQPSQLQTLSVVMIALHFLKRELETFFVHRFSSATMPASNIFKNSAHYWLLSGFEIAYFIYSPTHPTSTSSLIPLIDYTAVAAYTFAELANLNTHLILRNLRSPGGTERGVPQGFGFAWVTCPNYLFEVIAWVSICVVTRSWTTALFTAVAGGQMAVWAKKKESRYRKEMGAKYAKKKFAMIPGLI
ncbi:synaptic glyco protein SC2 [Sphaerulina musiva SO2202]|uniref:very-long-chain enoyl-CoA reductase n=1 Tax=Sphaerulina musiva (strain SO2202) TaxID=692275 RepID=N1QKU7_SPHMS|nr:synaptic glyco protein SC2 [Sphaerulina musiva SO2202]EMF17886.1 synaptic glyco protein SC2 [Sphaerulina musiva SO2202]